MKTLKQLLDENLHETASMKIRNEITIDIVKHWLMEHFSVAPAENFSKNSYTFHNILEELENAN